MRRRFRRTFRARRGRFRRFRRRLNGRPVRFQLRRLNRLVKPELKVHLLAALTTGQDINWTIVKIASIPQGVTQSNRVGTQVRIVGITLRGFVLGSGSAHNQRCRIIVLRNKNDNSNTLVAGDVFPSATDPIDQFKLHESRFKTKFLFDKIYNVTPNDLGAGGEISGSTTVCRTVVKHIRLNHRIQYNPSDATGATVEDGQLYIFCAGNNGTDAEGPLVSVNVKVTFYDM